MVVVTGDGDTGVVAAAAISSWMPPPSSPTPVVRSRFMTTPSATPRWDLRDGDGVAVAVTMAGCTVADGTMKVVVVPMPVLTVMRVTLPGGLLMGAGCVGGAAMIGSLVTTLGAVIAVVWAVGAMMRGRGSAVVAAVTTRVPMILLMAASTSLSRASFVSWERGRTRTTQGTPRGAGAGRIDGH